MRCRPAFALAWRPDAAETIGAVIARVAGGAGGVRPAAARLGVPYTTALGWARRFWARAPSSGWRSRPWPSSRAGSRPGASASGFALAAIGEAFGADAGLPEWLGPGAWRFASSVSGGRLIAAPPGRTCTRTARPVVFAGDDRPVDPG